MVNIVHLAFLKRDMCLQEMFKPRCYLKKKLQNKKITIKIWFNVEFIKHLKNNQLKHNIVYIWVPLRSIGVFYAEILMKLTNIKGEQKWNDLGPLILFCRVNSMVSVLWGFDFNQYFWCNN